MIPEYEKGVAIRLSSKQRQQIDRLVESEKFQSLSAVIRCALQELLEK